MMMLRTIAIVALVCLSGFLLVAGDPTRDDKLEKSRDEAIELSADQGLAPMDDADDDEVTDDIRGEQPGRALEAQDPKPKAWGWIKRAAKRVVRAGKTAFGHAKNFYTKHKKYIHCAKNVGKLALKFGDEKEYNHWMKEVADAERREAAMGIKSSDEGIEGEELTADERAYLERLFNGRDAPAHQASDEVEAASHGPDPIDAAGAPADEEDSEVTADEEEAEQDAPQSDPWGRRRRRRRRNSRRRSVWRRVKRVAGKVVSKGCHYVNKFSGKRELDGKYVLWASQ